MGGLTPQAREDGAGDHQRPSRASSSTAATASIPIQLISKSAVATPKLNRDVEMADLPAEEEQRDDVMQVARLGDVVAMEKLFEAGEYDATYADDEGITPLHVCFPNAWS